MVYGYALRKSSRQDWHLTLVGLKIILDLNRAFVTEGSMLPEPIINHLDVFDNQSCLPLGHHTLDALPQILPAIKIGRDDSDVWIDRIILNRHLEPIIRRQKGTSHKPWRDQIAPLFPEWLARAHP